MGQSFFKQVASRKRNYNLSFIDWVGFLSKRFAKFIPDTNFWRYGRWKNFALSSPTAQIFSLFISQFSLSIFLRKPSLHRTGIPQNFRLCKIGSKIRYIQWTKSGDVLCNLHFAKGVPPILRNKKTFGSKSRLQACSTFPLILGIYFSH